MITAHLSFAKFSDNDDILSFIRNHWRADHVFVRAPEVLNWQHHTAESDPGDLSFVIARNSETGQLIGLLGYISYLRFDPFIPNPSIALALWKTIESAVAGLGVRMLWFLQQELRPRMISVIGLNETVMQLYDALGYTVGAMGQWLLFPSNLNCETTLCSNVPQSAFKKLIGIDGCSASVHAADSVPWRDVSTLLNIRTGEQLPEKTLPYLQSRFVDHPFYQYHFVCVRERDVLTAVLIGRVVEHKGNRAFRAVDLIGSTLSLARGAASIQTLLEVHNYEFLEFLFMCCSSENLAHTGFIRTIEYPDMIVPAYFEPFYRKTVSIAYAFKCEQQVDMGKVRLCRADSDQDRPNLPPKVARNG